MVFFMKKEMNERLQKLLLGFASGVMIAASVWSLLIPAIEMAEQESAAAWIPAAAGFLLGMGFLLLLDTLTPHLHFTEDKPEGMPAHLKKTTMLVLAVTLHNIPEGMAVGVTFAGVITENTLMTLAGAFALSIGIAIQNFPEGAIISMPLKGQGISKARAFLYGTLSGIVGTGSGLPYDPAHVSGSSSAPVSAVLCSRCNDLCGGGRADPGIADGSTFKHRNSWSGTGIYADDDTGCSARMSTLSRSRPTG